MLNDLYLSAVQIAASRENTKELASYWQDRYTNLLEKDLFRLSQKSLDLLSVSEIIRPATTFGELVLVQHLGKNGQLDEAALQTTIETSVRLLDALLDKLNFVENAKATVGMYRKIGLGIADFKEYLNKRTDASELDEIDYLGNLVSSATYRSSESLAEEKGVCLGWEKINKHLRPKSFEYWYNVESGEVKNGLEMSEDYSDETILNSNYEIVPRRNVSLLLFPPDLEWQIWSDRDDTAPKTEAIVVIAASTPDFNLETLPSSKASEINSYSETLPVASGALSSVVESQQSVILQDADTNIVQNDGVSSLENNQELVLEKTSQTESEISQEIEFNQVDQPHQSANHLEKELENQDSDQHQLEERSENQVLLKLPEDHTLLKIEKPHILEESIVDQAAEISFSEPDLVVASNAEISLDSIPQVIPDSNLQDRSKYSSKINLPVFSFDIEKPLDTTEMSEEDKALSEEPLMNQVNLPEEVLFEEDIDKLEKLKVADDFKANQLVAETPQISLVKTEPEAAESKMEPKAENFAFQVGELVQLPRENNKVYQVLNFKHQDGLNKYNLTDGSEGEPEVYISEDEIEPVELFEILDKINIAAEVKPESLAMQNNSGWQVWANALIVTKNNKLLSLKDPLSLPSVEVSPNNSPEKTLISYLETQYNLHGRIIEEVGSNVLNNSDESKKPARLQLTFQVQLKETIWPDSLVETNFDDLQVMNNQYAVVLNKYNRRQVYWQNQIDKAKKSAASLQNQTQLEVQTQPDNQHNPATPNQSFNLTSPTTNTLNNNFNKPQIQINQINQLNNMSKYSLKLEQLVQSKAFGDVTVSIQYDPEGPKVVMATGQAVTGQLKHLLDTVLGLVNFALTKKITPQEVSAQLANQPKDGMNMPINDLLLIIAESLKTAPARAEEINSNILTELVPEKIMEAVNAVANPSSNNQEKPNMNVNGPEKPATEKSENAETKNQDANKNNAFFGGFGGRRE